MLFAYNLGITIYGWIIRITAFFGNRKAKLWVDGRKDWRQKLRLNLKPGERRIWFHCSSLGEFEQGRPLLEKYRTHDPDAKIVLTFFSPSGFEIRKNYSQADYILYLPLDTVSQARDFIQLIQPEKAFFIKYEFWFNLLRELNRHRIPVYLISAIFRRDHWFFRFYGKTFLDELRKVTWFFVQDDTSQSLLQQHRITQVTRTGDTRFDRVLEIAGHAKEIAWLKNWKSGKQLIVGGSTWEPDEEILISLNEVSDANLLVLIVPHETSQTHLEALRKKLISSGLTGKYEFLSETRDQIAKATRLVVVDRIGLLSSLYREADLAFIGGGFGAGIHNTLEAAVYGIPVVFGPRYMKFREAHELIASGGAISVSGKTEAIKCIKDLLSNPVELNRRGKASADYVSANGGATDVILRTIIDLKQ